MLSLPSAAQGCSLVRGLLGQRLSLISSRSLHRSWAVVAERRPSSTYRSPTDRVVDSRASRRIKVLTSNATSITTFSNLQDTLARFPNLLKNSHGTATATDSSPLGETEHNAWTEASSWLSVCDAADSEVDDICKTMEVHPLTLEDIHMREKGNKIEFHRNYCFITFTSFTQNSNSSPSLLPIQLQILVFPELVISFHGARSCHEEAVEQKKTQDPAALLMSSQWLTYALLDHVVDRFVSQAEALHVEIEDAEAAEHATPNNHLHQLLSSLAQSRRQVAELRRLVGHKADVIKRLRRRWMVPAIAEQEKGLHSTADALAVSAAGPTFMLPYLGDILDHLSATTESLAHCEAALGRTESTCLTRLQMESSEASLRANEAVSRLGSLGTVLLPLNLVTGLWGMNVMVPGQGQENLYWFCGLATLMLVTATVSWVLVRGLLGKAFKK